MKDQEKKVRFLDRIAWVISGVVLVAVVMMRRFKIETDIDFSILPPFHATLNALVAVSLTIAYQAIRRKNVSVHRQWMTLSMVLSIAFLVSYVVYHITTPETRYGGEGWMRTVYFILLISHVILAALILPFILFTFIRGYVGVIERHRRLARWVFPIWLYVALTGPICYLMLLPYYG